MRRLCVLTMSALCASSPGQAETIRVPEDVPAIPEAVAMASPGDVVLIGCGDYYVDGVSVPSGVEVRGVDRSCVVIHRGAGNVRFVVNAATDVVLAELTLDSRYLGVAILGGASATVASCTIDRGGALHSGGIECSQSTLALVDTQISNNRWEAGRGMGVRGVQSSVSIRDCTFTSNRGEHPLHGGGFSVGAAIYSEDGFLLLEDSVIVGNSICCDGYGSGVGIQGGTFDIRRTLFVANRALSTTVAAAMAAYLGASGTIQNCTFVANDTDGGGEGVMYLEEGQIVVDHTIVTHSIGLGSQPIRGVASNVEIVCSNFFGNQGGDWVAGADGFLGVNGNISADPVYCGASVGNYGLDANSPSAPPGSACGLMGAFPVSCGTVATEALSWGVLKSVYRAEGVR